VIESHPMNNQFGSAGANSTADHLNELILSAEASYHAPYDHGTSNFLKQAGVEHDFIRLEDNKIHGNGHMMMLEKNNHQIADFLLEWMRSKIK